MEILKSDKHKPFFFFFVLRYATSMLGKCFEFANLKERDWAEKHHGSVHQLVKNLRCNSLI